MLTEIHKILYEIYAQNLTCEFFNITKCVEEAEKKIEEYYERKYARDNPKTDNPALS